MSGKTKLKYAEIFKLEDYNIVFLMDSHAHLYWKKDNGKNQKLSTLPWKYQLPFYLKFLHNDDLSGRYKDLDIVGAIDLYIKHKYSMNEPLGI